MQAKKDEIAQQGYHIDNVRYTQGNLKIPYIERNNIKEVVSLIDNPALGPGLFVAPSSIQITDLANERFSSIDNPQEAVQLLRQNVGNVDYGVHHAQIVMPARLADRIHAHGHAPDNQEHNRYIIMPLLTLNPYIHKDQLLILLCP